MLRDEMLGIVQAGGKPAYRVASRMMFQGKWLRHAGMYPAYQVRFGRRDRLRFKQVGHGQREDLPPEDVGTLEHDLEHYSFSKGLHEWFAKHNRYSSDEAAEALRQSGDAVDWAALAAPDRRTAAARSRPSPPGCRCGRRYGSSTCTSCVVASSTAAPA